jgi:DNA-binding MarR family transcriptional regulator
MGKAKEQRAEYNTGTEAPIEVRHRNPIKELGFAMMEHALTLDTDLSDGAYRTYALLKFYWQHKGTAFPTVETMAEKRGLRRETVGVHLKELVDKGLITRQPRVGTSTLTHLEDLPQEYQDIALAELERRDARREVFLTATLEKSNARREENLTQSITIKEKEKKGLPRAPTSNVYAVYQESFKELLQDRSYAVLGYIESIELFPREWVLESFRRTLRREKVGDSVWKASQRLPYALRILDEWNVAKRILPERTSQPRQGRPAAPVTGKSWDQMEIYD